MIFAPKKNISNYGVLIWISSLTILVFLIIIIGGLTRLTESGLSMVNWQPLLGTIPPLTDLAWIKVFNEYKLTPEYQIVNTSISLENFKFIFWWEWFHRFFARLIGVVFIIPFFYFYFANRLSKKLFITLIVIFLFGQWMLKQGKLGNVSSLQKEKHQIVIAGHRAGSDPPHAHPSRTAPNPVGWEPCVF